jgi:hypothetical protein
MSNLSDFFAKAATAVPPQSGNTPHSQHAFTVVSGDTNTHCYDYWGHDGTSIGRQLLSPGSGAVYKANRNYAYNHNYASQPGNSSSYTFYGGHGITCNGYLGNTMFDMYKDSNGAGGPSIAALHHRHDHSEIAHRRCGTVVGLDQDYALVTAGYTEWKLSITNRSSSAAYSSSAFSSTTYGGHANNDCRLDTAGAATSGYLSMEGGVSHNQTTGNMVIMERASSGTTTGWRPVLLKNVPDPRKYVNRDPDFEAALTTAMATASNRIVGGATTSGNTARGGVTFGDGVGKVVLCDDNTVVLYLPMGTSAQMQRWQFNSASNTFAAPVIRQFGAAGTGISAGATPMVNWQTTLDGKESVFYSPYIYYACGFRAVFVDNTNGNTSNLHKAFSNSESFSVAPLGASKFQFITSYNSDSTGPRSWIINKRIGDGWINLHIPPNADYFNTTSDYIEAAGYGTPWMDISWYGTCYPVMVVNSRVDNKAIVAAEDGS